MGNLLGKQEQQLTESLNKQYQVQSHPYLLHRSTNQLCTLHKITTNSIPTSTRMMQIIEEYNRTKCESISKLNAHYKLEKNGYCSDEQTYYIIFRGQNSYTLKEEFVKRRFYQTPFRQEEIMQIVETYLCGLREYSQRFQREYQKIALESLVIDQSTKRVHLRDPWLNSQSDQQNTDNITAIMQSYPSPQKLNALLSPKMQNFNEFLSNLFSVGVICLQLKRLDFADSIYSKKRQIQPQQISRRLSQFRDQKLRKGMEFLLHPDPVTRKQIFSIWGIENREEHYLAPLNSQKQNHEEPKYQPQPLPDHKRRETPVNNPVFTATEVNPIHVQSVYIPNLPLQSLNSSRTGPIIKINTARTSSETQRANQFTIPKVSYHTTRHSQQKPQAQISFTANPHLSVVRHEHSQQPSTLEPVNRPQQRSHYFSFKEYMHDLDSKKQGVPNNLPISPQQQQQQNVVKFNREPSPSNFVVSSPNVNVHGQSHRGLSPSNLGRTPPIPQTSAFGNNIKESFTYLQISPPQLPQEKIRVEAQKTAEIASNYKETKTAPKKEVQLPLKIQKTETTNKPVSETSLKIQPSVPQKVKPETSSPPKKKQQKIQQAVIQKKELLSPIKSSPSNSTEQLLIKKQQNEAETIATPQRPITKHKYNSTIVEVKDQDTPDHSALSEDPIEEEYVVQEYETGSRYEGFKSGGMRNGRGRFYYQDGGYYQGQWKNNKMDGYGKLYYEGGKLAYEGQWSQDEFNGLGKVYNDNPVPFKTNFDYTNFDFLEDYWQYYEGMLVKDTKQGRGRIKLSNGEVFEGDFHEDKIQGFGKFHTLQGKTLEGIWRESKLIKVINLS